MVYDVTDRKSFDRVTDWMADLEHHKQKDQDVDVILVGNKIDLPCRVVTTEAGKKLADSLGVSFFETSALKNKCVDSVFEEMVRLVARRMPDLSPSPPVSSSSSGSGSGSAAPLDLEEDVESPSAEEKSCCF